jgi:hypothetical protein
MAKRNVLLIVVDSGVPTVSPPRHAASACPLVRRDPEAADFSYVHFTALPPLLFDPRADPDQFVNLADRVEYAGWCGITRSVCCRGGCGMRIGR